MSVTEPTPLSQSTGLCHIHGSAAPGHTQDTGVSAKTRSSVPKASLLACTQQPPPEFCQSVDEELGTVPKECGH